MIIKVGEHFSYHTKLQTGSFCLKAALVIILTLEGKLGPNGLQIVSPPRLKRSKALVLNNNQSLSLT